MAVPIDNQDYLDMLVNVLELNNAQLTCLGEENLTNLSRIRSVRLSAKEISEWAQRKSGLAANRGGCRWGLLATKCLQALSHWVNDSYDRGIAISPADFTPLILDEHLELVRLKLHTEESEDKTELPPSLKDNKWEDW